MGSLSFVAPRSLSAPAPRTPSRSGRAPAAASEVESDAPPALSISELYGRLDRALRGEFPGEVWVSGEVRSFNVSSRGHCYLDLVDQSSAGDTGAPVLKVVCWASRWSRVRATLADLGIALDAGLVVRVRGEVQLYKPRGDISFVLSELDTDALLGKVAAERARLLRALAEEGLLDANRERPVPAVPLRLGLVASPGTEGYRDFLGQLDGSGLGFQVAVVPTQVQGREAPPAIAAGVAQLQGAGCDLLVVVRGGGSKADLATFDSEPVARAIATSQVPVWVGIGHTGDHSVADDVANRSFVTPTECGQEIARRVGLYWESTLAKASVIARRSTDVLGRALDHHARSRRHLVLGARVQLDRHGDSLVRRAGGVGDVARRQVLGQHALLSSRAGLLARAASRSTQDARDHLVRRVAVLSVLPARRLELEDRQIGQWRRLLAAYDFQRQLERGYTVTRDEQGSVVRSADRLAAGSVLVTRFASGTSRSVVASIDTGSPEAGGPTTGGTDEGGHT